MIKHGTAAMLAAVGGLWVCAAHAQNPDPMDIRACTAIESDAQRLATPGQTGDRPAPMVDIFDKEITITGHSLTAEQKQKLHDVAVKCPVQRTLINGAIVHTADLKPALT